MQDTTGGRVMNRSWMQKLKAIAAYSLLVGSVWQLFEIPHYIANAQDSNQLFSILRRDDHHRQTF
jgi:hypothetical protein